jgi:hypothetical protein
LSADEHERSPLGKSHCQAARRHPCRRGFFPGVVMREVNGRIIQSPSEAFAMGQSRPSHRANPGRRCLLNALPQCSLFGIASCSARARWFRRSRARGSFADRIRAEGIAQSAGPHELFPILSLPSRSKKRPDGPEFAPIVFSPDLIARSYSSSFPAPSKLPPGPTPLQYAAAGCTWRSDRSCSPNRS